MEGLVSSYSDHGSSGSNTFLRWRILFISLLFLVCMIVILLRLFYLQVIQYGEIDSKLRGSIIRQTPIEAIRGQIYDRNGRIIVENLNTLVVELVPGYLPTKPQEYSKELTKLSQLINIDIKEIRSKLEKYDDPLSNKYLPIAIKSNVDTKAFIIINENKELFPGVICQLRHWRNYVLNENISHIVGYTGVIDDKEYTNKKADYVYRQNSIIGKRGIERKMDRYLRGVDGVQLQAWRPTGQPVPDTARIDEAPEWGKDIYLTIDRDLQEAAYRIMTGRRGAIIITKANSGEVLASVSSPGYDCNAFSKRDNEKIQAIQNDTENKPQFNRATRGNYPPSSIFKVVVAAAGLEEGVASPATCFNCDGGINRWGRLFKCTGHHGTLNLKQGIQKSCNSFFYQLGERIKYDNIIKMAENFGIGSVFDLDIGEEDSGFLPSRANVEKTMVAYNRHTKKNEPVKIPAYTSGHTYNISIGQGYLSLPLIQIHNIMSVIASSGTLYKPHFIKRMFNEETGNYEDVPPTVLREKFLSQSTVDIIQKSLRDVVTDGTAYYATFSKNYYIAGKTGTSQIKNKTPNALFSCYCPSNDVTIPYDKDRIVISVLVENGGYGGSVSAPIATSLALLYFENIPIEDTLNKMGLEVNFEPKKEFLDKIMEGSSDGNLIDENDDDNQSEGQ